MSITRLENSTDPRNATGGKILRQYLALHTRAFWFDDRHDPRNHIGSQIRQLAGRRLHTIPAVFPNGTITYKSFV